MSDVLSFLDIEAAFERLIMPAWSKEAYAVAETAAAAVEKGDEEAAIKAITGISTKKILSKVKGPARALAVSALLLGASRITDSYDGTIYEDGDIPPQVQKAVEVFMTVCGRVLEEYIRKTAPLIIDELFQAKKDHTVGKDQGQAKVRKAVDMGVVSRLNDAVNSGGQMMASIGANLTTSRLVSYGFLSQAQASGVDVYKLEAVMDQRTSQICRHLNGRTFSVTRAYSYLQNVLQITDPNELKSAAPWLKSDKSTIDDLEDLSTQDLEDKYGVLVPPFHPSCRTVLAKISSTVTAGSTSADVGSQAAATVESSPQPQEQTPKTPMPAAIDTAIFQKNALNNLYKMPAGETENTVKPPFPVEEAPYSSDKIDLSQATNAEVRVTDLVALTDEVSESSVKTAIDGVVKTLPLVVHTNGKFYVQSGLASVVAADLMGDTTVSVKLVSF